ncbi:hypothetical protein SLE2022_349500 [Rubroshorea leprosula]|uniref:Ribosomal protein S1 n=1 Tax=Rubroshorea leprosula TaxID=152421 RepID=A0AAV5MPB2_9ROSI|nr:hypothetical protein SLEP1_g58311 [Rubroshorea leprosula]
MLSVGQQLTTALYSYSSSQLVKERNIVPFIKRMTSIYLSRSFPRSNSSFFLCSGNALQSEVLRLREDKFLLDVGIESPKICMQDEPTGVPINRTARFENKVESLNTRESLIKKRILERSFIDIVSGQKKERAAARFKEMVSWKDKVRKKVGATDVVGGERLFLLPRRFRKNRAWMELNKILRTKKKVKGFIYKRRRKGYLVAIAGYFGFIPFRPFKKKVKKNEKDQFTIKKYNPKFSNFVVF